MLLAGCGGDGAPEDGGGDGASDAPALVGPLVYERSGGLAAEKSQITLRPDGRATFATERIALQPGCRAEYAPHLDLAVRDGAAREKTHSVFSGNSSSR